MSLEEVENEVLGELFRRMLVDPGTDVVLSIGPPARAFAAVDGVLEIELSELRLLGEIRSRALEA